MSNIIIVKNNQNKPLTNDEIVERYFKEREAQRIRDAECKKRKKLENPDEFYEKKRKAGAKYYGIHKQQILEKCKAQRIANKKKNNENQMLTNNIISV